MEEQKSSAGKPENPLRFRLRSTIKWILHRLRGEQRGHASPLPLTDMQKAAFFLLSLPPGVSSRIICALSPGEMRALSSEMAKLPPAGPRIREEIMQEVYALVFPSKERSCTVPSFEACSEKELQKIASFLKINWLSFQERLYGDPSRKASPPGEAQGQGRRGQRGERLGAGHPLFPQSLSSAEKISVFLSHLPNFLLRRIFTQLTPQELSILGSAMLTASLIPEETKQRIWSQFTRWLKGNWDDPDAIARLISTMLKEETPTESEPFSLNHREKAAIVLLSLPPPSSKAVFAAISSHLSKGELERLIMDLRQLSSKVSERERLVIVDEFFSFLKSAMCHKGSDVIMDEGQLLEEIERIALKSPSHVARCLEIYWLSQRNLVGEIQELAEQDPSLVASRLLAFMEGDGEEETLTSRERAALLLRLIHPEISHEVLNCLEERDADWLRAEGRRRWKVTASQKKRLFEEFLGQYYHLSSSRMSAKENPRN